MFSLFGLTLGEIIGQMCKTVSVKICIAGLFIAVKSINIPNDPNDQNRFDFTEVVIQFTSLFLPIGFFLRTTKLLQIQK